MTAPLSVSHLAARYGARRALDDVSFTLAEGEFVSLLGPNGSGKSTLVRALTGFVPPAAGEIRFGDRTSATLTSRDRAKTVAVVPQAVAVPFAFTAREVVAMGRFARQGPLGSETSEDRAAVAEAMQKTDCADFAPRPITELSAGELQRVLIARALAQAAPILLLDEPTAHLDLRHQIAIFQLLRDLARVERRSVLCIGHDLNLAAGFSDRLILLSAGKIVADGPPAEVLTAAHVETVYGVKAEIQRDPKSGRPRLIL